MTRLEHYWIVPGHGLHFPNPIGLAAGFDKDAKAFPEGLRTRSPSCLCRAPALRTVRSHCTWYLCTRTHSPHQYRASQAVLFPAGTSSRSCLEPTELSDWHTSEVDVLS
jgi:hypothetical protein